MKKLPERQYKRHLLYLGLALPLPVVAAGSAHAQATSGQAVPVAPTVQETAAPPATDSNETLVVTGARGIRRSVATSTIPIDVITPKDLKETGKAGLQEALADLLPSFALPSQAGGNISSIVRTATLRGLDADQVLILINGKRRHVGAIVNVAGTVNTGSQAVDLNMIPMAAIDHIEVLRDGAAAQYGSDAIAGVINIILKNSDHGGTLYGSSGIYEAGDGITWTTEDDAGFKLGSDGFLHISYEGIRQDHTGRAVDATEPYYYPGDPRNDLPKRVVYSGYGQPQEHTQGGAFNTEKPVTPDITFYGFGTFAYNDGQQWENFRPPSSNDAVIAIYPNGEQPHEYVVQKDFGLTLGLKGDNLLGWNWDLSSTYGRDIADIYTLDSVNSTYGDKSPTAFHDGAWVSGELTNNFDMTHAYEVPLLAAPLNVAVGIEQRADNYRIIAGDVASYANGGVPILTGPNKGKFLDTPGAQSQGGFLPSETTNLWRDNVGGYVDLETRLLPEWQIGLAGRFEHYSDFGNDEVGKFSTRYDVTKWVAFRGAISNGFRAPSLGEEGFQAQNTSFYKGVPYNSTNLPVYSVGAEALGARPLRPETSMDYSAGFVVKPMDRMTVTVDGYEIDINNRIVESAYIGLSPTGVLNPGVAELLRSVGLGSQAVGAARYFLNGAQTQTRGVDIIGDYRSDFNDFGHVLWTLALNLNDQQILSLSPLAKSTEFGTQVLNKMAQDDVTKTSPKSHLILGINYTLGRYNIVIHEHRWGSLVATSTVPNGDSFLSPHWTTDLDIGYMVLDRLRVSVGAQNLFNAYPDKANALNFNPATFNGAQIYNANSPYGISGGFYYIHANYNF